jgi:ppGpp synthetase/RelA/SpoT-type nucleotidyltranferase
MTDTRTIEDRLREEYFDLLPDIRRVAEHLETEVRYWVLPICHRLDKYERLLVRSRIKECESAVDSLRPPEGGTFDRERPTLYTLTDLHDLAGVRVLAFPGSRLPEIDHELRKHFVSWEAKPLVQNDQLLAFKYSGYCQASTKIRGELQIVSMLIGLFWEVEHSALYKPTPELKGVKDSLTMKRRCSEVYTALRAFDEEFEAQVHEATRK